MANEYWNFAAPLTRQTLARASALNGLFEGIAAGFDKIPSFTAIISNATDYVEATGAGGAYVATLNPTGITSYTAGLRVRFKASSANGPSGATINLNGLGVKSILTATGGALPANTITTGSIVDISYDGTNFRLPVTRVQSAAEILAALLTVDGEGTGLDADTVRGTTPAAGGLAVLAAASAGAVVGIIGAAAASHGHAISDVSGLQAAIDGKAALSHTHSIANITGLQAAIDGKAPLSSPDFTGQVDITLDGEALRLLGAAGASTRAGFWEGGSRKGYVGYDAGGNFVILFNSTTGDYLGLSDTNNNEALFFHDASIGRTTVLTENNLNSVTGVLTSLSGKANTSHTHSATDITSGNLASARMPNVSGSAPAFSVRAWANIDGTGTVNDRNSGNVSSITDNGTGDYRVNFATALPTADYAAVVSAAQSSTDAQPGIAPKAFAHSTTSVRIRTGADGSSSSSLVDSDLISLIVVC